MEIGKVINDTAMLNNFAAKQLAEGNPDGAIDTMMDLRELVNEPIEVGDGAPEKTTEEPTEEAKTEE